MKKKRLIPKGYGGMTINTYPTTINYPQDIWGSGITKYDPNQSTPMISSFGRFGKTPNKYWDPFGNNPSKYWNPTDNNEVNTPATRTIGIGGSNGVDGSVQTEQASLLYESGEGNGQASEGGDFMQSKGGQALGMAGQALASSYNMMGTLDRTMNSNDEAMENLRGQAAQQLLSGQAGPWGMLAGGILMTFDKTGGFSDASEGLGDTTDTLNSIAALALPGAGYFLRRTDRYKKSQELATSASYTGTSADGDTAQKNAGAKILIGRGKAQNMIRKQRQRDLDIQGILKGARDDANAAGNSDYYSNKNRMEQEGGYAALRVKKGGIIYRFEKGGNTKAYIDPNIVKFISKTMNKYNVRLSDIGKYSFDEFMNYIKRTGRDSDDYDYEKFYDDKDGYADWAKREQETPGEAHFFDTYKKPTHITFSVESIYSNPKNGTVGGEWIYKDEKEYFKPSDFNIKSFGGKNKYIEAYKQYNNGDASNLVFDDIQFMKNGGCIIPAGKLHKERHHIETRIDGMKNVTRKGIPIVLKNKAGELRQQAEIERDELIIGLSITEKILDLMDSDDDDAAFKAGKILSDALFENTEDNTGLIKTIKA